MDNIETFKEYFKAIVADMSAENKKIPVDAFRAEGNQTSAQLFAPDWFQYMIYGRGPGKQPPPDRIFRWVERNPDILERAKQAFKYINAKGLAYIIGRKIGREGTDIWLGKRKGVDLLGAMERNMPDLLKTLALNETINFQTSLHKAIATKK